MNWFIFFLILVFLPIPVTFNVEYNKNNLSIYLFKIKVYPLNKTKKKKKKKKKRKKYSAKEYLDLVSKVNDIKFKPHFYFTLRLDYGLDDAASTALLNGILWSLSPLLYKGFSLFFSVKKLKLNITPNFDKPTLFINIKSIIFINIAKIIYISLILILHLKLKYKSSLKPKEVV